MKSVNGAHTAIAPDQEGVQKLGHNAAFGVASLPAVYQPACPQTLADCTGSDTHLRTLIANAWSVDGVSFLQNNAQVAQPGLRGRPSSKSNLPSISFCDLDHLRALNAVEDQLLLALCNKRGGFSSHARTSADRHTPVADTAQRALANQTEAHPGHMHAHGVPAAMSVSSTAALMQMQSLYIHGHHAGSLASHVGNVAPDHATHNEPQAARPSFPEATARTRQYAMLSSVQNGRHGAKAGSHRPFTDGMQRPFWPAMITTGATSSSTLTRKPGSACGQRVMAAAAMKTTGNLTVSDEPISPLPEDHFGTCPDQAKGRLPAAQSDDTSAALNCPVWTPCQGPQVVSVTQDHLKGRSVDARRPESLPGQEQWVQVTCSHAVPADLDNEACSVVSPTCRTDHGIAVKEGQPTQPTARHAVSGTCREGKQTQARDTGSDAMRFVADQKSKAGAGLCWQRSACQTTADEGAQGEVHAQCHAGDAATACQANQSIAVRDQPLRGANISPACNLTPHEPAVLLEHVTAEDNKNSLANRGTRDHHVMLEPAEANGSEEGAAQRGAEATPAVILEGAAALVPSRDAGASIHADPVEPGHEAVCFTRHRLQQVVVVPVMKRRRTSRRGALTADGVKGPPRMGGFAKRVIHPHRSVSLSTSMTLLPVSTCGSMSLDCM